MRTLSVLLGTVVAITLANVSSASATGDGADVWGSSDQFHFCYVTPDDGGEDLFGHACDLVGDGSGFLTDVDQVGCVVLDATCYWEVDNTAAAGAAVHVHDVIDDLKLLFTINPHPPLGVMVEDALFAVLEAHCELTTATPDPEAAVRKIGEAVAVAEAALELGAVYNGQVEEFAVLIDGLTGVARDIAFNVINPDELIAAALEVSEIPVVMDIGYWVCVAYVSDAEEILAALDAGDELRLVGACSQAIAAYQDALDRAEALVAASKVKVYIKDQKMMSSLESVEEVPSENVNALLDAAIARVKANRRSTVKAQDL